LHSARWPALISLSLGGWASADTIVQYNISGSDNGQAALYDTPPGSSQGDQAAGTLYGWFKYDTTTSSLYSADITATAATINLTGTTTFFTFDQFEFQYNTGSDNSTDPTVAGVLFTLDAMSGPVSYSLTIALSSLPSQGNSVTLGPTSSESETNTQDPTRYANTAGTSLGTTGTGIVTPAVVPEPSSIVLASSALAISACGGWLRRRGVASRLARACRLTC
jgi:hypothetical protein